MSVFNSKGTQIDRMGSHKKGIKNVAGMQYHHKLLASSLCMAYVPKSPRKVSTSDSAVP